VLELVRQTRNDHEAAVGCDRAGEGCARLVAGLACPQDRLLGDPGRSRRLLDMSLGEVELGVDVEPERPRQRKRALEQAGRGSIVFSAERPLPRRQQAIPRAKRERRFRPAQLRAVAGGLLEVVTHDLVELYEGSLFLEPAEDNGHGLPLLLDVRHTVERSGAAPAEGEAFGVRLAATAADRHPSRLERSTPRS
jgi:hypothetical protein